MSRRISISSGPSLDRRQPVLQVFVKPCNITPPRRLRVAVHSGAPSEDNVLACTQPASALWDPLFEEPLVLWDEASGKDGSVPLTFVVEAVDCEPPEPLASARIGSDLLRRFGLYNPREGAAVALPLQLTGGEPPRAGRAAAAGAAALHCYVHVGYSPRRSTPGRSPSASAAEGPIAAHDPAAGKRFALEVVCTCRAPPGAGGGVQLQVRARNTSRRRALRLCSARLHTPPGSPWVLHADASAPTDLLSGSVLPPGGRLEVTFSLQRAESPSMPPPSAAAAAEAAEAVLAAAASSPGGPSRPHPVEVSIGYALHEPADAGHGEGEGGGAGGGGWAGEFHRRLLVTLPHPDAAQPLVVRSHSLRPAPPELEPAARGAALDATGAPPPPLLVGSRLELEVQLAWGDLDLVTTPRTEGEAAGLGAAERPDDAAAAAEEPWLVELQLQPAADWVLVGASRQRVSLPRAGPAAAAAAAAAVRLTWQLVPLRAGYMRLPTLSARRLWPEPGSAEADPTSQQLPPPLFGAMALVLPAGARARGAGDAAAPPPAVY